MDDYETNETLLYKSQPYLSKKTSVTELIEKGIHGDKIVIGKPLGFNDVFRDNEIDTELHWYISNFTGVDCRVL
jgi:hypothetical protein